MAVAFVRTHTGVFIKTVGTTNINVNISTATTAGNTLVAYILFDNFTTASKPIVSSIAKMAGETNNWVFLGAARSTSTSSGAFASGEIWAIQTTVDWSVATYTVTLDSSVTMKATITQEFSGATAVQRSTAGTAYSTTTTAASAATTGTTPVTGDLTVGFIFGSNVAAVQAGDTDTTGGSWSAMAGVGSTGSSAATNNFGGAQYKILTGANAQTLNNSAAMTAGNGAIVAILQQYAPAITQKSYRIYADGTETGSTALAAQDTSYTADVSSGDVNLQVRTLLQTATSDVVVSDDFQLQWEKNSSGTWTSLAADTVIGYNSANLTDAAATTNRLTGGTGSFVAGKVSEDGLVDNLGWTTSQFTELLYSVTLKQANLANSDTLRFRVLRNGSPTGFTYTQTPTISITKIVPAITQAAYRIYADGTESGSTALAAQNTSYTADVTSSDVNLQLRMLLQLTTGVAAPSTDDFQLQWEKNASGTWTNIGTAGTTVLAYDSANLTDGAATTNRLTGGTGTFTAGKVSEDGLVDDLGWAGNNFTELLYSLTLKRVDLGNGDTLRFRVLRNGFPSELTYTSVPTVSATFAWPTVNGRSGGATGSSNVTSHPITLPAGITIGEMLYVYFACPTVEPVIAGSSAPGWQLLYKVGSQNTRRHYVFRKKVVDASNDLTLTTSSTQSAHISYRIGGAVGGTHIIGEDWNGGTGVANFDMQNVGCIYGVAEFPQPMLSIVVRSYNVSTGTATSAPAGYSDLYTQVSTGSSPGCLDAAVKNLVASSEDSGPWTHPVCFGYNTITLITAPIATDLTAAISDDFSTLDTTTKWTTTNTSASAAVPTVSSGRLVLTSVIAANEAAQIETQQMYDVTEGSVCVELVDPGAVLTQETTAVPLRLFCPSATANIIGTNVDHAVYFRLIGPTGTLLDCRYRGGNLATIPTNAGAVTFNATDHRWLRLRESGGFVYWDASADGILWNNLASIDWSLIAGWDPTHVIPSFSLGRSPNSTAATTSMLLDNFNLPPGVAVAIPRNTRMTNAALQQSFTR